MLIITKRAMNTDIRVLMSPLFFVSCGHLIIIFMRVAHMPIKGWLNVVLDIRNVSFVSHSHLFMNWIFFNVSLIVVMIIMDKMPV